MDREPDYDAHLDRLIDKHTRDDTHYGICPDCGGETHECEPCSGCEDCTRKGPCSATDLPCGGTCEECGEKYCLNEEGATDDFCGDCETECEGRLANKQLTALRTQLEKMREKGDRMAELLETRDPCKQPTQMWETCEVCPALEAWRNMEVE